MSSADWALQRAIHSQLSDDTALTAMLGSARIYDDVPRDASFPYVTIGHSAVRDWSTGSDDGSEHIVSIHVWSRGHGRRRLLAVMQAIREALHDRPLTASGHRVVNIRQEFADTHREADGETLRGLVRFRVVTERL